MSLYLEFDALVRRLESDAVRYALVGGLAVGVYGHIRATEDIDILVHAEDADRVAHIAADLGFRRTGKAWTFKNSGVQMIRYFKTGDHDEDVLLLDVMIARAEPATGILQRAQAVPYAEGRLHVPKRQDLVAMKRLRGSAQDQADIEHLEKGEHDG